MKSSFLLNVLGVRDDDEKQSVALTEKKFSFLLVLLGVFSGFALAKYGESKSFVVRLVVWICAWNLQSFGVKQAFLF